MSCLPVAFDIMDVIDGRLVGEVALLRYLSAKREADQIQLYRHVLVIN